MVMQLGASLPYHAPSEVLEVKCGQAGSIQAEARLLVGLFVLDGIPHHRPSIDP